MQNIDKSKGEILEKAVSNFMDWDNCAESVLMTMQEWFKIEEKTPNIATGFGGGIGRMGSVCGAVTGGVLSINLKFGRKNASETEEEAHMLASEFYRRFEEKFGSVICYDLIGCKPNSVEGKKKFNELNLKREKCVKFVKETIILLIDLIDGYENKIIPNRCFY